MNIVRELLSHPSFKPSKNARADLDSGAVDLRLVKVLIVLVQHHAIEVSIIKTGHPMGPTTPSSRPNDHYFYRVADIPAVDGKPVLGNGSDTSILHIGRILRRMTPQERPDQIMGPAEWHAALGLGESSGFISDAFHNAIHADHLHIGFGAEYEDEQWKMR